MQVVLEKPLVASKLAKQGNIRMGNWKELLLEMRM